MNKKIVIGCDDASVALKNILIPVIEARGFEIEDIGVNHESDKTEYPFVAEALCNKIIDSDYEKDGILLCGTGIGMAMTANKFPGIFAAVCHDNFSAERSRLSNNGNVLCMGSRVVGPELAKKIAIEWLNTEYVPNTSSQPKVDAMRAMDRRGARA